MEWKNNIPDDLKTEKFFETYPNDEEGLKNILKTAAHAHKRIGENPLKRLTPTSTPEERKAFFKEIGAKEKPEEYLFEKSEHVSEDQLKTIQQIAYDSNMTMEQAKALFGFVENSTKTSKEMSEKQKKEGREILVAKLREEFGDKYDAVENKLGNVVKFLGEDFQKVMESSAGSDYNLVKSLLKVGELLEEDKKPSESGFSFIGKIDLATAEMKLERMKKDPEFAKRLLSKDKGALAEWQNAVAAVSQARLKENS